MYFSDRFAQLKSLVTLLTTSSHQRVVFVIFLILLSLSGAGCNTYNKWKYGQAMLPAAEEALAAHKKMLSLVEASFKNKNWRTTLTSQLMNDTLAADHKFLGAHQEELPPLLANVQLSLTNAHQAWEGLFVILEEHHKSNNDEDIEEHVLNRYINAAKSMIVVAEVSLKRHKGIS